MLRLSAGEKFHEIPIEDKLKKRYAISNHGRLISYTLDDYKDAMVIKGGLADGYRTFQYRKSVDGVKRIKSFFLYKLVAIYFIPKTSDEQTNVLHLDYKRDNDHFTNLKWATREEMLHHSRVSPHVIAARQNKAPTTQGRKLNSTQVMRLKKELLNPNRKTRLKILAKQFGVSEMQLQRIKTGENWGHIKVDLPSKDEESK